MAIDNLVYSVLPYVWLTLGLAANIYLFITLTHELRVQGNRFKRRQEGMAEAAGPTRRHGDRAQASDAEWPAGNALAPAVGPGMNLAKRNQAMRMLQRGERREQVAVTLDLRPGEVDLLYKVQGILAQAKRPETRQIEGKGEPTA